MSGKGRQGYASSVSFIGMTSREFVAWVNKMWDYWNGRPHKLHEAEVWLAKMFEGRQ